MNAIGAIELGAILRGAKVGSDAEVALGDGLDLHRQRLRQPAFPLGLPFRRDLCADDEGRNAEQQRALEPGRFERKSEKSLQRDVERPDEAEHENAQCEQRRCSAEDLSRQETPDRPDVLLVELQQLRRTGGYDRRLAHRFPLADFV